MSPDIPKDALDAALTQLRSELERSTEAYRQDPEQGCRDATLAMIRLLQSLDRPDLDQPFRAALAMLDDPADTHGLRRTIRQRTTAA
jgi:hypothetical protein